MLTKKLSDGTVHKLPKDLKQALVADSKSLGTWQDITPLARNEYICWVTSAKKQETRDKRVKWAADVLAKGKRRPCCWAGCIHRAKNGS